MRRLVVGLAVLAALLVGADRVVASLVAKAVAEELQVDGGLATKPDVTIHGFPFLTQALAGHYDDVEVDTGPFTQQGVRLSLDVRVLGADVPLGPAVRNEIVEVPVEGLRGTAVLGYADVAEGFTVRPAGQGVEVAGSVVVLGQKVTGTATSDVSLQDTTLVIKARSVALNGQTSPALSAAARTLFDLRVPLGTLPYGLEVTSLQVRPDGLHLSATSGATVLRDPGLRARR